MSERRRKGWRLLGRRGRKGSAQEPAGEAAGVAAAQETGEPGPGATARSPDDSGSSAGTQSFSGPRASAEEASSPGAEPSPFEALGSGLYAPPEAQPPAPEWFEGVDLSKPPAGARGEPATGGDAAAPDGDSSQAPPRAVDAPTEPIPIVEAGEPASGGTLGELMVPGRERGASGASGLPDAPGSPAGPQAPAGGEAPADTGVLRTVSIADLAEAHRQASVEQSIAGEVAKRRERRRTALLVVALAVAGSLIGAGIAFWAVARERRTGGAEPKVGLADAGVLPSASPTAAPSTEPTGPQPAQVVVFVLGAGDGSNETSANLAKFAAQRLALTYGVLAQRAGTSSDAAAIQASGGQTIVYQPIGGEGSSAQGQRGGVDQSLSNRQYANMLIRNIAGVSGAAGLSPYGFATAKYPAKATRLIPAVALRQNVLILESQTGTQTPLGKAAGKLGARYLGVDIRLDDRAGERHFRSRWERALDVAEKQRRVVAVCRLTGLSARVLPSLLAALDTNEYQVTLSSSAAESAASSAATSTASGD